MDPQSGAAIAREVFGLLFDTSSEAIFIVDRPRKRIVAANARSAELLSRELGSLVGCALDDLLHEPRDVSAAGHYEDVALRGSDDYPVYVDLQVAVVELAAHGAVTAYTARDTSELRLLQRELVAKHSALFAAHGELERAHAQLSDAKLELETRNQEIAMLAWRAAMGELVAGIAHHLNNPVGALASTLRRLASVLERTAIPDEAARRQLEAMFVRASQIARRIETNVGAIVEASRSKAARSHRTSQLPVQLPAELASVLATFTEQLADIPTKDPV